MDVELVAFKGRAARSEYLARRFRDYLHGALLDVGCDRAVLRGLLPDVDYTGVDVAGEPDITLNLEQVDRLPFEDGAFDCVVCSDVLEHLDNLHHVFAELVRVARGHLVVSLPNNWANARRPVGRGKGGIGHYGLPAEPPADRHKWFFSLSEAAAFFAEQARHHPIRIVETVANEKPRPVPVRWLRRLRYPAQERYLNRYAHTLWAVFEKSEQP